MKKPRKPKPTNPKVVAGGLGAAMSPLALWVTGVVFFGASHGAHAADKAIASVPWPVSTFEAAALAVLFAWLKADDSVSTLLGKRGWDWGGKVSDPAHIESGHEQ